MESQQILNFIVTEGGDFLISLLTAIVAWVVGRWLIKLAVSLLGRMLERGSKIDATLSRYLQAITAALLTLVLILAILDIFGVRTTSFAALLAGAGVAIGAAWSGMLGNFAAGVFMQVLRPYKVGDFISAGGVEGTVRELGLFATTLVTGDNVLTTVGNARIFSDNIKNYSALPVRQVACETIIANSVDPQEAMVRLQGVAAAIPNVVADPAAAAVIVGFTPEGPRLSVRAFTHQRHYWQVYTDLHRAVIAMLREAGYPVPETPVAYRLDRAA